jgi:riboflavin synthase
LDVFTGLVAALGRLEQIGDGNGGRQLTIHWPDLAAGEPLELGESVAVNGCCLTVIAATGQTFLVQAGPETLERTNLSNRRAGDRLNLERALKVGDRLGGHFVQGHIDTTAILRDRRPEGEWEFLDVSPDLFSVMLIPHTLANTTLGIAHPGDRVNIEVDILAKHVQKLLGK